MRPSLEAGGSPEAPSVHNSRGTSPEVAGSNQRCSSTVAPQPFSLAWRLSGITAGDEVIIPAIQFHGVANAVMACGATPVFADVDPHSLNIAPGEVERVRTPRSRAIFLLHYGGHPAPMDEIWAASDGLLVFEDAANAVASNWRGQACGTLGDGGVWSFDAMKILVAGDGGALWLRSGEARRSAEVFRYLGMPPDRMTGEDVATSGAARWWEIEVEKPSGRFVSNDVAAAIGMVQLAKVARFVSRRREIWDHYTQSLTDVGDLVLPPEPAADCTSSYYLYWIQSESRDALASHLYRRGIYSTFRYHPLHRLSVYGSDAHLPHAEAAAQRTLCIPIHQNLSADDVDTVVREIRCFFDTTWRDTRVGYS